MTPQPEDWYAVDPREFGEPFVQADCVSKSTVVVKVGRHFFAPFDTQEFLGFARGPVDPMTGEFL